MLKKFIAALAVLFAASAFAAVDANKATQAELEAIKGIGPVISTLIINERKKGEFKDWNDLVVRVKGVGDRSAEKFSEGGLTVNGKAFSGAAPAATTAKTSATATRTAAEPTKTAAEPTKTAAESTKTAAESTKRAAKHVKEDAKAEKDAAKDNVKESVADAKTKRAEKKAERAEKKAEKAEAKAAAASAPKK
jgi:competence protein ComEA